MNVGELKAILSEYPDEMEVIRSFHSDYDTLENAKKVEAVYCGHYIMRVHDRMSAEKKAEAKEYLLVW